MKRSLQEVVELVVFGLIALLIGTGVLWLGGWVMGLVGLLLKFVAGLIWWLLRFIVPVAIVAGLIYFLVRVLQGDRSLPVVAPVGSATVTTDAAPAPTAPTAPAAASAQPATGSVDGAADETADDTVTRPATVVDTEAVTDDDGAEVPPEDDDTDRQS